MSFDDFVRGRSLAARLTLWFAGLATLLVLSTAALMFGAFAGGIVASHDQLLLVRALAVRQLLAAPIIDLGALRREVTRDDVNAPRHLFIRVSGVPGFGALETADMPDLETASPVSLQADERRYGEIESGGLVYRTLTLRAPLSAQSGGGFAAVEVAVDTSEDFATLTRRAWMAGIFAAFALVLGTLAAWYVVRTQLLPLRRLASAAAGVEQSTLNRRVSLQGLPSELEEFGGQFNHMLERLEIAYGALRRYADDVAHELRTPINRIQLGAEVALRDAGDVEVYREALESTLEECMHLGSMVKSLLFLARVENGQARLMPVTLNVAERLEKVRAFFEENAADGNIAFSVVCDASLSIMADPTLFQRALSNVVANAFAHTPRGGRISIRAAVDGPGVVVEVADSGEGIAPEHQGRIFDRFYRADGARVAVSGRVGLGLAITKSIVDLHQGRVWLESRVGSGTRVFLFFPFRQDVAGMDPGALS